MTNLTDSMLSTAAAKLDPKAARDSLQRFIDAQKGIYPQALTELKAGRKTSHWMWFIFPQLAGLGRSPTAQFYAIDGVDEALAYLQHPILGKRLIECCQVLLSIDATCAMAVFGSPDNVKLKSSLTLFDAVQSMSTIDAGQGGCTEVVDEVTVFAQVLGKFYAGEKDEKTLELLGLGAN